MSLKDRLISQQKKIAHTIIKEEQPQYYTTNKDSQANTLGILEALFLDDDLSNIFVSGAKNIYVEKKNKIHKSTATFKDNVQLENIIKKIAQNSNVVIDESNPYFKFNYEPGINVTATFPPLSNVVSLFIKCYKDKHSNLQTMREDLIISKEIALILEALCTIRKNILIIGEKNTFKTTLLSALSKKTQTNDRAIIIDSENEIEIKEQNYTNYNFTKISDTEIKNILLDSIFNLNPEKLFINTNDEKLLADSILKLENGYKGLITTLCAKSNAQAIEKLAQIIEKNHSNISLKNARALILDNFDIIITVKKDEIGRKKISSISEIDLLSKKDIIQDIFTLNYQNQHNSTGVIPKFFEDIKNNSLPISDNIFDSNYKHTYYKTIDLESTNEFGKKNPNIDILKKFKKELPTQENNNQTQENQIPEKQGPTEEETQELIQETIEELKKELSPEELMQKAQEKFDELKKTAQKQGEFELKVEDFEQNQPEETKNENL